MSVQNFIPQIWAAQILLANQKNQKALQIVNRNYEGLISQAGDRVKINTISPISVSDYTKNSTSITYSALNANAQWLVLDQAKYWSASVDDIDAAQSNVDIMAGAMAEASYRLSDAADSFIFGLHAGASVKTSLGTDTTPIEINSTNALDYMDEVSRRLSDASCPAEGRFMAVPPWFYLKLQLAKITNEQSTNRALEEGYADKILGFNIVVSNNISNSSSTAYKILAGTTDAITYADGIVKTEALRLSTAFADGLRGLHVYGGKVVKGDYLACLTANEAAES